MKPHTTPPPASPISTGHASYDTIGYHGLYRGFRLETVRQFLICDGRITENRAVRATMDGQREVLADSIETAKRTIDTRLRRMGIAHVKA